jgi:hypothetical protein
MKPIFLIVLVIIVSGCIHKKDPKSYQQDTANVKEAAQPIETDTTTLINQFTHNAKPSLDLTAIRIKEDTLEIVSGAGFFYYPFGKFNTLKQLLAVNTGYDNTELFSKDTYSGDSTSINKLSIKNSFIKFLYSDETNRVEVLSGEITDTEMPLTNGIRIGMSKGDLLKLFFDFVPANKFTIIEFKSALDGIWHYYTFENNKLISIRFDTDYTFEK